MKLAILNIERIDKRMYSYSEDQLAHALDTKGIEHVVIGSQDEQSVERGQFLDVYKTGMYKFRQLSELLRYLAAEWSTEEVTVYLMDLWCPGLEMLAYVRDNARHRIRIKGRLHAGCYDSTDFVSQNGCGVWGRSLERAWLQLTDEVFVSTHFHADKLRAAYGDVTRLTVIPEPVCPVDPLEKEDIVVFPHRWSADKQPEHFEHLRERSAAGAQWVATQRGQPMRKHEYYDLLGRAKVAFSAALHENYGVAMLEAASAGCAVVVPDRCSYRETFPHVRGYRTLDEAHEMIQSQLQRFEPQGLAKRYESPSSLAGELAEAIAA